MQAVAAPAAFADDLVRANELADRAGVLTSAEVAEAVELCNRFGAALTEVFVPVGEALASAFTVFADAVVATFDGLAAVVAEGVVADGAPFDHEPGACWADVWDRLEADYRSCRRPGFGEVGLCWQHEAKLKARVALRDAGNDGGC